MATMCCERRTQPSRVDKRVCCACYALGNELKRTTPSNSLEARREARGRQREERLSYYRGSSDGG